MSGPEGLLAGLSGNEGRRPMAKRRGAIQLVVANPSELIDDSWHSILIGLLVGLPLSQIKPHGFAAACVNSDLVGIFANPRRPQPRHDRV
jgi:hypothetical protein